jgi:hypothetical protein
MPLHIYIYILYIYIYTTRGKEKRKATTGKPRQKRWNRTGRTEQPDLVRQNGHRQTRTGQKDIKNGTGRKRARKYGTGRTGQADRTRRTGQAVGKEECDRQNRTARQDRQNWTMWTCRKGQAEKDRQNSKGRT